MFIKLWRYKTTLLMWRYSSSEWEREGNIVWQWRNHTSLSAWLRRNAIKRRARTAGCGGECQASCFNDTSQCRCLTYYHWLTTPYTWHHDSMIYLSTLRVRCADRTLKSVTTQQRFPLSKCLVLDVLSLPSVNIRNLVTNKVVTLRSVYNWNI